MEQKGMQTRTTDAGRAATGLQEKALAVLVLALVGGFLLWGTGFAGSAVLHNAAHDARHSFAFPCH
jgi:cobalt transporter subunit CbtB